MWPVSQLAERRELWAEIVGRGWGWGGFYTCKVVSEPWMLCLCMLNTYYTIRSRSIVERRITQEKVLSAVPVIITQHSQRGSHASNDAVQINKEQTKELS